MSTRRRNYDYQDNESQISSNVLEDVVEIDQIQSKLCIDYTILVF